MISFDRLDKAIAKSTWRSECEVLSALREQRTELALLASELNELKKVRWCVVEEKFVPTEAQLKNIIADTQVFDKDMEILVDIY